MADVLATCSLPFVPQLPRRGDGETMLGQAAVALHGVDVVSGGAGLAVTGDVAACDDVVLAHDRFAGLHAMVARRERGTVKTQVVGPATLAMALTRASGEDGIDAGRARQVAVTVVSNVVVAMVRVLGADTVVFLDEPSLVLWAAPGAPWPRRDMVDDLAAVIDVIVRAGAIAGVHVCGDGDVGAAVDAGCAVVGVEPGFAPRWTEPLRKHHCAGGAVAWAAVPNDGSHDARAVAATLDSVASFGPALVTPACGLVTMRSRDAAVRTLALAEAAARRWRPT